MGGLESLRNGKFGKFGKFGKWKMESLNKHIEIIER
jgi:hypothetical protein